MNFTVKKPVGKKNASKLSSSPSKKSVKQSPRGSKSPRSSSPESPKKVEAPQPQPEVPLVVIDTTERNRLKLEEIPEVPRNETLPDDTPQKVIPQIQLNDDFLKIEKSVSNSSSRSL